jgi:hypothetical protein
MGEAEKRTRMQTLGTIPNQIVGKIARALRAAVALSRYQLDGQYMGKLILPPKLCLAALRVLSLGKILSRHMLPSMNIPLA